MNLGPTRRWVDDGILYAENDFIRLAWAPTDDPNLVGQFTWYGSRQIGVELMARQKFDEQCHGITS